MQLACPKCGTREIRVSHRSGLIERIKGLLGIYPLRCRRCRHRWLTSAWAGGAWRYARCPRCYRQELTTWSEQYYHPPRWTVMLLRMGATPYRCAACRCNFASFKACKERFSWRHETKVDTRLAPKISAEARESDTPPAPLNGPGHYVPATPAANGHKEIKATVSAVEQTPIAAQEPAVAPQDEFSEPFL